MAGEANEAMDREITVNRDGKWLHIRIPLPSFKEECQFTLEPMKTVGDLCAMIKKEDNSITDCVILLKDGVRVASSTSIDSLREVYIRINTNLYKVNMNVGNVETPIEELTAMKHEARKKEVTVYQFYEEVKEYCTNHCTGTNGAYLLLAFVSTKFAEYETKRENRFEKLSHLELAVVYRCVIESSEKYFLERKRREFETLSRVDRWKSILSLVDNSIISVLLDQIDEDDQLTTENFPSAVSNAHTYFSLCIHNYVHEQKKFFLNQFDTLPGFIIGRKTAKKVMNILFKMNGSIDNSPDDSLLEKSEFELDGSLIVQHARTQIENAADDSPPLEMSSKIQPSSTPTGISSSSTLGKRKRNVEGAEMLIVKKKKKKKTKRVNKHVRFTKQVNKHIRFYE